VYFDSQPCAVCGSDVTLRPNPGASPEKSEETGVTGAKAGLVGPADGVVGEADETVDVRECTNPDCPTHRPGGPDA
jgi:hypothetical protein